MVHKLPVSSPFLLIQPRKLSRTIFTRLGLPKNLTGRNKENSNTSRNPTNTPTNKSRTDTLKAEGK